jgi:hypothetical protein
MIIYKYPITTADEQTLTLPLGSKILSVQCINEQLYVYALVDENSVAVTMKTILVFGTGQEIEEPIPLMNYIGTVQQYKGMYIWHVFERR